MIRPDIERIARNVAKGRKKAPGNHILIYFEQVLIYVMYLEAQQGREGDKNG